jgi:hypothetical protein
VDHVHVTLRKEPCVVIGTSLLGPSIGHTRKKSSSSLIPTFVHLRCKQMFETDGKFLLWMYISTPTEGIHPLQHPRQMASTSLVPHSICMFDKFHLTFNFESKVLCDVFNNKNESQLTYTLCLNVISVLGTQYFRK